MSAFIKENTQFYDQNTGTPLLNGKLYIGSKGNAPKTNLIIIFSDRELTVELANPQTLNAFGESTNKIWIPGQYSMQVDNSNDVQKFIDLDAGVTAESGITSLGNVQGTNTITAGASTTITTYVDKEIYIFKLANTPSSAVTLNIDSVGAKAIVKHGEEAITDSDGIADDIWAVAYNSTNDNFELQSNTSNVVDFYEGTAVASAATTDIWATDGNTIHITGTTACTSFGTAPNVGARRRLIYDDAVLLTNSANLALQGQEDFTSEAGDVLDVYADTTTQFDIIIHKVSGEVITNNVVSVTVASNDTTIDFTGLESGFDYELTIDDYVPVIATDVLLRTSTDGGSTYDSGATDYSYVNRHLQDDASSQSTVSTGDTSLRLNTGDGSAGPDANEKYNAKIYIYNPANIAFTYFQWEVTSRANNTLLTRAWGGGIRESAADVDAFQILTNSGNIASGNFILRKFKRAL